MNRFATLAEIQERFFIIKYSISEVLNIVDIDYIDFLLSFTACLFTTAIESDLEFDNRTLESITKWIKYFKGDEDVLGQLDKGKTRLDKAYNFFKGITTILLRELTLRDMVRNAVQRNMSQLLNVINAVVMQISTSLLLDKELLVIIDDLEKIPDVNRADRLFNQAGA